MIKCVYWGGQVTQENAQNVGQMRGNFQVAIAGSNGYVTTQISTPAGYQNGVPFGKFAINAPYDAQGYNTYMGAKIFTGTWDVSQCSNYCDAQTRYNNATAPKDGTPFKVCRFFNTYLLQAKLANGTIVPQGQYCSLYTEAWPIKYAVNGGQWRGQDQYTVDYSFGYAKTDVGVDPTVGDTTGAVYQARQDMTYSPSSLTAVFQPFCSSLLGYTPLVATTTPSATITPFTTATATVTVTHQVHRRRDGSSLSISRVIPWPTGVPNPFEKRAAPASTPNVLTKYPAAVQSGACSLIVTQATSTSTTTAATVTFTASTQTSTVTATVTAAATPSGALKVQGGTYDGLFIMVSFDYQVGIYLTTNDPTKATVLTLDSSSRLSTGSGFAAVLNAAYYDSPDPYDNALVEISNRYGGENPTCNFASGSLSCAAPSGDARNILQICPDWPQSDYGTGPYLALDSAPLSGCETVNLVFVQ